MYHISIEWSSLISNTTRKVLTFSRALTSATVLESSATRLSLIAFANSWGVLGLDCLKNENDIFVSLWILWKFFWQSTSFNWICCDYFANSGSVRVRVRGFLESNSDLGKLMVDWLVDQRLKLKFAFFIRKKAQN